MIFRLYDRDADAPCHEDDGAKLCLHCCRLALALALALGLEVKFSFVVSGVRSIIVIHALGIHACTILTHAWSSSRVSLEVSRGTMRHSPPTLKRFDKSFLPTINTTFSTQLRSLVGRTQAAHENLLGLLKRRQFGFGVGQRLLRLHVLAVQFECPFFYDGVSRS